MPLSPLFQSLKSTRNLSHVNILNMGTKMSGFPNFIAAWAKWESYGGWPLQACIYKAKDSPVTLWYCVSTRDSSLHKERWRLENKNRYERIVTAACQQAIESLFLTSHTQLWTMTPNIRGDLQNVINVLCNKVSIFVVIWSRMTFTVIGTAALKAADQSTD